MRILMLANSSIPYMKFWNGLGNRDNEILIVSTYEKGEFMSSSLAHIRVKSPLGKVASYLKLLFKLPWIIRKFRPDILISHYVSTRGIIAFLSGFRPHMIMIMGSDIYDSSRMLWPLICLVLRNADAITTKDACASDYILKNCESVPSLSKRIVVKLRGFTGNIFNLQVRISGNPRTKVLNEFCISKSQKYILSPRCIDPVYNQDVILKAFSLIKEKHSAYKLIMLFCKSPDRDYLRRLRKMEMKLGIVSEVIWINRILSEEEMADLFSFSDAFINVPKSDQLAATLTEGIACGSFPIVSKLPPYDLVVENGENGLYVEPKPLDIARKFDGFASNQEYYLSNALENAKNVRKIVGTNKKYLDFINRLASRLVSRYSKVDT